MLRFMPARTGGVQPAQSVGAWRLTDLRWSALDLDLGAIRALAGYLSMVKTARYDLSDKRSRRKAAVTLHFPY
jgi:hypothetical protein